MPNRSLFHISADLLALADLLTEAGGDITDAATDAAITAWFAELDSERDTKLDHYAALILELEARARARVQESLRLTRLADSDTSAAKRLRQRLLDFFQVHGLGPLHTARFALAVVKNGGSLPVVYDREADALPPCYQKAAITYNTAAIREALDAGVTIPGVQYGARGVRMSIR